MLPNLDALEASLLNTSGDVKLDARFRTLFTLKGLASLSEDRLERVIEIISKGFADDSALLKHEMAYVLGQLKDTRALPCLNKVLSDEKEHAMVRHEAAEAMGAISSPDALPVLNQYLHDPDVSVRETCHLAINKIQLDNSDTGKAEQQVKEQRDKAHGDAIDAAARYVPPSNAVPPHRSTLRLRLSTSRTRLRRRKMCTRSRTCRTSARRCWTAASPSLSATARCLPCATPCSRAARRPRPRPCTRLPTACRTAAHSSATRSASCSANCATPHRFRPCPKCWTTVQSTRWCGTRPPRRSAVCWKRRTAMTSRRRPPSLRRSGAGPRTSRPPAWCGRAALWPSTRLHVRFYP